MDNDPTACVYDQAATIWLDEELENDNQCIKQQIQHSHGAASPNSFLGENQSMLIRADMIHNGGFRREKSLTTDSV